MSENVLRVPDKAWKKLREAFEEAQACDGNNPEFHLPDLRKWAEKRTLEVEVKQIEQERARAKTRNRISDEDDSLGGG